MLQNRKQRIEWLIFIHKKNLGVENRSKAFEFPDWQIKKHKMSKLKVDENWIIIKCNIGKNNKHIFLIQSDCS